MTDPRNVTIRIIRPSSHEKIDIISTRIKELEDNGFHVLYDEIPLDSSNLFTAGSISFRKEHLLRAVMESDSDVILCARGGYGASDLLPFLPWNDLKSVRQKPIIGFSDISALHSAFFTKLSWKGIHGPMPSTSYWLSDPIGKDILNLLNIINSSNPEGQLALKNRSSEIKSNIIGWLFGGCLSVLTNLIGTPYFPASLKG
ncbi:MAG: LD-carboxypeptidase, partial [Oligoflexales bacterium]|nr:LD-carboxypeptidase [Oligoflexales bacterium]